MTQECEYCGQEERYGHNAICIMNTVEELRVEIERLKARLGNAPVLSKYHGQRGFELERFIADYSAWTKP